MSDPVIEAAATIVANSNCFQRTWACYCLRILLKQAPVSLFKYRFSNEGGDKRDESC